MNMIPSMELNDLSKEDTRKVITELCGLVQACFDTLTLIDERLEEGYPQEAQNIIDGFYAAIEDVQGELH